MMKHKTIKELFKDAVDHVASNISSYVMNPGKDLIRNRKMGADKLITYMVSCGASGTKPELLDFFDFDPNAPSASAFNQQRAKLKPDALEAVLHYFNSSVMSTEKTPEYRFLAADGSTFTFFSKPSFASSEYFVSEGHSAKGFYSMHLNAIYDLQKHIYTDALIQSIHQKDEFRAFCDMVDNHIQLSCTKNVFIGDRGYCSYNNMAHVIENGHYFLFRTKDIHSKGLIGKFDFPDSDSFDITVNVTLARSNKKTLQIKEGFYRRFVDASTSFDYLTYGFTETYDLTFRIVRFPISDDTYECIVTNLPQKDFPADNIKLLYHARWGIESSFRKLKYTIGLSNFHSYKPDNIKQEIWAKIIAYNITETLINNTAIKKDETKYEYNINFSVAAHICRIYLRITAEKKPIDVRSLLCKELIPVRKERKFPRLKTAHFRRPKYFIYRSA